MNALIPFDFESHAVRSVMIDGRPCFVGVDVCRAVEIAKPSNAMSRLDDDERVPVLVDTLGGRQTMIAVTESGLFALILTSRKAAARRFRKLVTSEVLPALWRDGTYSLPGADGNDLPVKRALFDTLPDTHRAIAQHRVDAVLRVEALVADGQKMTAAVSNVAAAFAMSVSSVWTYRRTTYMVPKSDWLAALAPHWSKPRGMRVECHPDGLRFWLDLTAAPSKIAVSYRSYVAVATANSWFPIPPLHTMRRAVARAALRGRALA